MHKEVAIAKNIVKKYKTCNPFDICEKRNIVVNFQDLGKLRGFYRYSKRNKVITINSSLEEHMRKIVCAHELGHEILHSEHNRIFLNSTFVLPSRFENQANRFAVYLLLHEHDIETIGSLGIEGLYSLTGIPEEYLKLII